MSIFKAAQHHNIVVTLFRVVTTLFQHCNAVLRLKSWSQIVLCNNGTEREMLSLALGISEFHRSKLFLDQLNASN